MPSYFFLPHYLHTAQVALGEQPAVPSYLIQSLDWLSTVLEWLWCVDWQKDVPEDDSGEGCALKESNTKATYQASVSYRLVPPGLVAEITPRLGSVQSPKKRTSLMTVWPSANHIPFATFILLSSHSLQKVTHLLRCSYRVSLTFV